MSREVIRRFVPFLLILLVAGAEEGLAQVVIDAGRHHLGTAGRPEWQEFAGSEPEGRGLELRFEGRANPAEATLLIRQRDVKLGWDVRINDRRIGRLHPHGGGAGPRPGRAGRHPARRREPPDDRPAAGRPMT